MSRISGRGLFFSVLGLSLAVVLGLSAIILLGAQRADQQLQLTVERQLLERLRNDGLSGLSSSLERRGASLVPGQARVEVVVARDRGGELRILQETAPGLAMALGEASGAGANHLVFEGQLFSIHGIDVATASQAWDWPMLDVQLTYVVARPTTVMQQARQMLFAIGALYLTLTVLTLVVQAQHWRRYRQGIANINALLTRYSEGESGVRFRGDAAAPELQELHRNLATVLPKMDALFDDLRTTSAHLAHELKTPLQTIRSALGKMTMADRLEDRQGQERNINQIIDRANARLHTVMQLFRLQAGETVAKEHGVELGAVLMDAAYDYEDQFQARGLSLTTDIDETIQIHGNVRLVELMISNLLSNAAKYTPENGHVQLHLSSEGGQFLMQISNEGRLPDEAGSRLFSRFAQGDGQGSKTGSGLGLYLVQAIAEEHAFSVALDAVATMGELGRVRFEFRGALDA